MMAGRDDAFIILVVMTIFCVAGYLADMMRTTKSHQDSCILTVVSKYEQQISKRMHLKIQQTELENTPVAMNADGLTMKGRKDDCEGSFYAHQQRMQQEKNAEHGRNLRELEYYVDDKKDRMDRKIDHTRWEQASDAVESAQQTVAANFRILQKNVKEKLETETEMNKKHQQALQTIENMGGKMTTKITQLSVEASKKIEQHKLEEENARRLKEAAERALEEERRRAEEDDPWKYYDPEGVGWVRSEAFCKAEDEREALKKKQEEEEAKMHKTNN